MEEFDEVHYKELTKLKKKYAYIEKIPSYCRTQSIAFYMAIRNRDAIRLLDRINIILAEDKRDRLVTISELIHLDSTNIFMGRFALQELIKMDSILSKDIHNTSEIKEVLILLENMTTILGEDVLMLLKRINSILKGEVNKSDEDKLKKIDTILNEGNTLFRQEIKDVLIELENINLMRTYKVQDRTESKELLMLFKKVHIILEEDILSLIKKINLFLLDNVNNPPIVEDALVSFEKMSSFLDESIRVIAVDKYKENILKKLNDDYGLNRACIDAYADMKCNDFMLDKNIEIDKVNGALKDVIAPNSYVDGKLQMTDGGNLIEVECPIGKILFLIRKYYEVKNKCRYDDALNKHYIEAKNGETYELNNNIIMSVLDDELQLQIVDLCNNNFGNLAHLKLYYPVPELTVPTMNKVSIQVNLTYPEDELIELMKEYKRMSSEDDSIVQSFMNTLEEDETKLPIDNERVRKIKKTKAELLVDNFFIYDYIRFNMNECESKKKDATDNYEQQIAIIQKRRYKGEIDDDEKFRALKAEKEIYDENYHNSEIIEYFQDKTLQCVLKKKESSIRTIYYIMHKFINDRQYMKLMG